MRFIDRSFDSLAENVAYDEQLLMWAEQRCEASGPDRDAPPPGVEPPFATEESNSEQSNGEESNGGEIIRVWEARRPLVVVGRSTRIDIEVNEPLCQERNIPILRRASGGAAIVAGPGCLMYAVVLSYQKRPALRAIDQAHAFVLGSLVESLERHLPGVARQGISDLTWNGRKFSGNALRCKREHVLYHGTLLYDFPLSLVAELLRMPPRQPAYRAGRSHEDFIGNLPLSADTLRNAVREAFRDST